MATKPKSSTPSRSPDPEQPAARRSVVPAQPAGALVDWQAKLAERAVASRKQLARISQSTSNAFSFRGGSITFQGQNLGHEIAVIPLAVLADRAYYSREFDPADKTAPDCYSYDGVEPHEKAAEPQAETCAECPHNEFGSDRRGRGKACKEGLRLACVSASVKSAADVASADLATMKFSVMNAKAIRPALDALTERFGHIAMARVNVTCNPSDTTQIANTVELIEEVPAALKPAIVARLDDAERLISQPYPEPTEPAKPARAASPKAPAKGGAVQRRRF
jgi:hypothetical protein